jgi:hypothetical protein
MTCMVRTSCIPAHQIGSRLEVLEKNKKGKENNF